jgi:SNF2 family DNA or RNA helicase
VIQWAEEIRSKVKYRRLSVHIYHGNTRAKSKSELSQYDVVVTSYGIASMEWPSPKKKREKIPTNNGQDMMTQEDIEFTRQKREDENNIDLLRLSAGILFKVKWHRIVLDEAHFIKNKATRSARAVSALMGKYRWCLSGTPIQVTYSLC